MASIERTAYPRLKKRLSDEELRAYYSLNQQEKDFIRQSTNGNSQRLTFVALFKIRQRLGYFIDLGKVPDQVKEYLADQVGLPTETSLLNEITQKKTRSRYRKLIREYLSSSIYTKEHADRIELAIRNAAYTMSDPSDLINVAVEELIKSNIELPAFSTLDRLVNHLRSQVHEKLYRQITRKLTADQKAALESLLIVAPGEKLTEFSLLKQTPGTPTLSHIKRWVDRLDQLNKGIDPKPFVEGIPYTKIRQFASEATAYTISDMRGIHNSQKRRTLLLCLLHQSHCNTRDQLIEMFLRRMNQTVNKAKDKLRLMQEKHRELEESLISVFGSVLQKARADELREDFGSQVLQILSDQGGIESLAQQYEMVSAFHKGNYMPMLWQIHATSRSILFKLLDLMQIGSSNQDTSLLEALDFVRKHRDARRDYVPFSIDIGFASQRWQIFVQIHEKGETVLNKRSLEVCVFLHLAKALRSGDIFVLGSQNYSDYRSQLLSWEECQNRVGKYCQTIGLPENGKTLVASLYEELTNAAKQVDANFPKNTKLTIDSKGNPHLKKQKTNPLPEGLNAFEEKIREKMPERHLLDILKNTNHWTQYTESFGPASGSDPKLEDASKRYLFTVFGYGCNLGASQTARHAPETINHRLLRRINMRHINTKKLEAAVNNVISEYTRFDLPKFWGQGQVAIADGTHIELRENNLIGEQHVRYGRYGGIGYHHISDTYIALFSNFISCGVWEAVYILDGLLQNKSALQPDTLHADTHGQSEPVFGLARLMGIKLMPRMRTWNDIIFYRPEKQAKYSHIDGLFTDAVDWKIIETHWKDMMQVVLSIQNDKVLPSMLFRKLGTHNRKNKLYRAFRELGRVERTLFLLRYISDPKFRQSIQAETTKIESYNDFLDWVTFGGAVIKSGDPIEQAKHLKYTNLVANAIMLHNVVDLTEVLLEMVSEGYIVTPQLVSRLSPYMRQHIRRFGQYVLNMENKPNNRKPS